MSATGPVPIESTFSDEAGFRAAVAVVISAASREIRIFDDTLDRLTLENKALADSLRQFLAASPAHRLRIAVHDPRFAEAYCPRLVSLIRQFSNSIEVRETPPELKHITDCFVLADQCHGAIRFHRDFARGKLLQYGTAGIRTKWQRFDELWQYATPCLAATRLGL